MGHFDIIIERGTLEQISITFPGLHTFFMNFKTVTILCSYFQISVTFPVFSYLLSELRNYPTFWYAQLGYWVPMVHTWNWPCPPSTIPFVTPERFDRLPCDGFLPTGILHNHWMTLSCSRAKFVHKLWPEYSLWKGKWCQKRGKAMPYKLPSRPLSTRVFFFCPDDHKNSAEYIQYNFNPSPRTNALLQSRCDSRRPAEPPVLNQMWFASRPDSYG